MDLFSSVSVEFVSFSLISSLLASKSVILSVVLIVGVVELNLERLPDPVGVVLAIALIAFGEYLSLCCEYRSRPVPPRPWGNLFRRPVKLYRGF